MNGVLRACGMCRGPIDNDRGVGRIREYCSRSCRQRAYEIRRTQQQLLGELGEHQLGRPRPRTDLPPLPTGAWRGVLRQLRYQLRATTIDPRDRDQILALLRIIVADHDQTEPHPASTPSNLHT